MTTEAEPSLRVLSWKGRWGRALREAVCDRFTVETGIQVEQVPHVGLSLKHDLTEALERGDRPPVEVVWSNASPALRHAERGHAVVLPAGWSELPLSARAWPAASGTAGVVFPYVVYYVLVYRRSLYPVSEPESWRCLLDRRHVGKVALYPGGKGLFPIAQVMGGGRLSDIPERMEPCFRFIRELGPQVGELDYSIGMEAQLAHENIDLCFRALTNALGFQEWGADVGFCVPQEGTSDTLDAFWIPRGLPEEAQRRAERFIALALRSDVQTRFAELLGAHPVNLEAQPPSLLRRHPRLPDHADDVAGVLHIPELVEARHEPVWATRFEEALRGRGIAEQRE